MPKERSPNRDKAFEIYKQHGGKIENRAIAELLGEKEKTISNWKCRDKWNVVLQTMECSTTKEKGGQPGNRNAQGSGAPPENKNAEKHGLFAKYLPAETMDIISHMSLSPLDILWDQIQVAYAAIIRAQSIMHVTGKDEMIKELKKRKSHTSEQSESREEEWNFQFAWERQAQFMSAQARAQSELRGLIKQYDAMLHKNWDMTTEEQRSRIDLVKAQAEKIQKDVAREQEQPIQITFRRASEGIGIRNTEEHEPE